MSTHPATMRALIFDGRLQLAERPVPVPGPDEARVRVDLAGICNTDLEITRGYLQHRGVLGHEFVGTVDACAQAQWVGARVVGEINIGCGACDLCARDLARHCRERRVLGIQGKDGALAEHLTLPVANLHRVPAALPDEAAVFIEPLAAACEIAEQVHLRPGLRALVLGDGKLGLLVVQVLLAWGGRVSLLGRAPRKLQIAAELGAQVFDDEAALDGRFDLVVEATGAPAGLATAIARTRPRGTLVLKSTYAGEVQVDTAPLVVDEISVVGSRCGRFGPALDLLTRGAVQTAPLLTAVLPLSQALDAFALAQAPDSLKVALRPD